MYIYRIIYKKYILYVDFILLGVSLLISCEREGNNDNIVKIENAKSTKVDSKLIPYVGWGLTAVDFADCMDCI